MKNLYLLSLLLLSSLGSYAQCIQQGNFEGTLAQVESVYSFTSIDSQFAILNCNVATPTDAVDAALNTFTSKATLVTGTGFDPLLESHSIFVTRVHTGNGAIKLGDYPNLDNNPDSSITAMRQNFTPATNVVSFDFSLILEDGHATEPESQPFFTARIYNQNGEVINTNEFCIAAHQDNPIFTAVQNTEILYTGWRCGRLNIPDEFLNQLLTLEFIITDCGQGAHLGSVYIDNITCSAACSNPPLGFIELNPVQYNCPTGAIDICGVFSAPLNSTIQGITMEVIQNNAVVQTLTNPQITGNTYCFSFDPYSITTGGIGFELYVTADFLMNGGFVYTLFDQSAVPGPDLNIATINPYDATVTGNILSWPDVSDSYDVEFVSDDRCCPGRIFDAANTGFITTLSTNTINLNTIVPQLRGNTCFRWRIRTGDCPNWSDWCCLATTIDEYPSNNYSNLLDGICYPDGCLETLHAEWTPSGNIFEQREIWITAVNNIPGNAIVTYQAGEYIELQPGFETFTEAVFTAQIGECTDISSFALKNVTQSIKEEESRYFGETILENKINGFTVYPNPTTGLINVTFENKVNTFSILDITGKELMRVNNNNPNEITLDLSNLAAGIYFLNADGKQAQKIVKN